MYETLFREHLEDCANQAQLLQINYRESTLTLLLQFSRMQAVWKIKSYGVMEFGIRSTTTPRNLIVRFQSIHDANFESHFLEKNPQNVADSHLPEEYLKLGEDGYLFAWKLTITLESITMREDQQLSLPFPQIENHKPGQDCASLRKPDPLPHTMSWNSSKNLREQFSRHIRLGHFRGDSIKTDFDGDGGITSEVVVHGNVWQITSSDVINYQVHNMRPRPGRMEIGWASMYGYFSEDKPLQSGDDLLMLSSETIFAAKYTYRHINDLRPYKERNVEQRLPFRLGRVLPESGIRNPNTDANGRLRGTHEHVRAILIEALQEHVPWDFEYYGDNEIDYLRNERHSIELDLLYIRALPFYARYCGSEHFPIDERESWHNYAYRIIQAEYPPHLLPEGPIRDTILNTYYRYPSSLPDDPEEIRKRYRFR